MIDDDGRISRPADGTVGDYSFWLGDAFGAEEPDDEADSDDDSEGTQGSFGFGGVDDGRPDER